MRHLFPFHMRLGSRQKHPSPIRAIDLSKAWALADDVQEHWQGTEARFRKMHLSAMVTAAVVPILGWALDDWTTAQLFVYVWLDMLFLFLGDLIVLRVARRSFSTTYRRSIRVTLCIRCCAT